MNSWNFESYLICASALDGDTGNPFDPRKTSMLYLDRPPELTKLRQREKSLQTALDFPHSGINVTAENQWKGGLLC